eukprot:505703_1
MTVHWVSNLCIYGTKSFESGNSYIRHSVQHKAKCDATYSDAIFRRCKLKYTMLFLMRGGGWDAEGNMVIDANKAKYILPDDYLNHVLKKYSNNGCLNWISRLLEYKYIVMCLPMNVCLFVPCRPTIW